MSKRQIIFDTETTGLDPNGGDRITEIGCVEVIDLIPTGKDLRILINPERDIPPEVTEVTGHTWEMLKDEPKFAEVVDAFLDFVKDSELVAHNAGFDRGFINMELKRCGKPEIDPERFIDTAAMARKKFPGAPASLDALCKRFDVSLESRTKHGALIDSYLLAAVYLELNGGREQALSFSSDTKMSGEVVYAARAPRPQKLESRLSDAERAAHDAFVGEMDDPLWRKLGLLPEGSKPLN
jgi:DNA polymerase-3 subunit epsilon